MSAGEEIFFTIVGCMDGRCQEAVAAFGRETFHAQFPDTITEAGLVGLLAKEPIDEDLYSQRPRLDCRANRTVEGSMGIDNVVHIV